MIRIVLAAVSCATLAMSDATVAFAQEASQHLTVASGIVAPHKDFGEYANGVVGRVGIERVNPSSHWRFRLDGEGMWMKARPSIASASGAKANDALFTAGIFWNALGGPVRPALAPHALIGVGMQAVIPRGSDVYAAGLLSARFGGGVRGRIGKVHVSLESAGQLALLSSYGPIASGFGMFWPTTLSVTF